MNVLEFQYGEKVAHLYEEELNLYSTGLLSKGGFWDGDQFSEYIYELFPVKWDKQEYCFQTVVLKKLIDKYLIPALPVYVKLVMYHTCHNSIRVCEEDYEELATQPEVIVSITEQQLREMCEETLPEYLREVND